MERAKSTLSGVREKHWHFMTIATLWVLVLGQALREWFRYGMDFAEWDWMLLSGLIVFLIGAYAAFPLPQRLDRILADLSRRHVLIVPEGSISDVTSALDRERRLWRLTGGLACSFAIAAAFAIVLTDGYSPFKFVLGIVETIIAFPAGRYLGSMAHTSMLSRSLSRHSVEIVARPGALDGTGGLKAIGDHFFLQASVVSLPAVYLAAWLVLIPFSTRYTPWLEPFSGLLFVALVFVILAFVLPLWAFHTKMKAQKRALAAKANGIAARINTLKDGLLASSDQEEQRRLQGEIDAETRLYREIETMPVWPIARVTMRRFTINNTILSFPLVARGLDEIGVTGEVVRWFLRSFAA